MHSDDAENDEASSAGTALGGAPGTAPGCALGAAAGSAAGIAPGVAAAATRRPIILIGMMGSGKSTVGRRLATRLEREFYDADKVIEKRCGVPITTIFELEGEDGFRRRETALLDELSRLPGIVLATGGGAVLREENRRMLRERGCVVFLRASVADLWQRLRRDKVRPLLQTADPRRRIADLLAQREPLYQETAHLSVLSGRQSVEELVTDIIERLSVGQHTDPSTAECSLTASPPPTASSP